MSWILWLLAIGVALVTFAACFALGHTIGLADKRWFEKLERIFPSLDDELAGVCHICRRDGQDTYPTDDGTTEIMICTDCKSVPHIQQKWSGN